MKHEKSCGAAVFRKHGGTWYVLLIRHARGKHISFPKGHMEPGELESHTAEREVYEETGIQIRVDRRYRAENRYKIRTDIEKLVVIFAAVTRQTELALQTEEIAEANWVSMDEAVSRLTYDRDRKILIDAYRHIRHFYDHQ